MSVAPHAGVVDFGTFTPPTPSLDGIQGEVPQPLIGQENYVLTGNGWSSLGALGALTYQGTWNASTNTPTLVSSVGVQGYYYVVSVAGNTDLNGTTTWDVGDWAIFNGSAWQKIEGGTVGTFTNVITPQVTARTDNLTLSAISTGVVNVNTLNGTGLRLSELAGGTVNTGFGIFSGTSSQNTVYTVPYGTFANSNMYLASKGSGNLFLGTNSNNSATPTTQAVISHTASAVNYVQVTGAATTAAPVLSSQGSDTNIALRLSSKGSGTVDLASNGNPYALQIQGIASGSNYNQWRLASGIGGSALGSAPVFSTWGIDTNISMAFQPKGTGAIDLAAGSSGVNISNGGTVTGVVTATRGNGYTALPSVAISAPTTAGGVQAVATALLNLNSLTLVSGGTGYTVNDVLTVSGVTGGTIQLTVNTVSAGVILTFTVTNFGSGTVSAIPANPVSVTGGTGTGATFTANWNCGNITVGTAGSGYVEQPTVTITGGASNGTAYATVGSGAIIRGIGSTVSIHSAGGEQVRFGDTFVLGTSANYWTLQGRAAGAQPAFGVAGSDTNISAQYNTKGTGQHVFYTNGGAQLQLAITHTASAVNYVQVTGGVTGGQPRLSAQGSDASIALRIASKGTFNIQLENGAGNNGLVVNMTSGTTLANYVEVAPKITGTSPVISALGTDTNISLNLVTKGTGTVQQNGNPLAQVNHKYHAFTVGSYYYDSYEQNNYFRLFSQNAAADTIRYGAVNTPEYYDYGTSTWTAWAAGTTGIQNLLDGNPNTGMDVAHANRTFRFVVTNSDGWPTNALVMLQTTWSAVTYTTATVTIASGTAVGGPFTTRQVMVFSSANSGNNWGLHAYYTGSIHTGEGFYQITIDLTDWVDSTTYTTYPLRNLNIFSNYSTVAGRILPFSNSYDKRTTFIGGISTADDASGSLYVGRYSSADPSTYIDSGSSALRMNLRTQYITQLQVSHTASAVNYVQVTGNVTTGQPTISAQGSDTNVSLSLASKGTGIINLQQATNLGRSSTNWLQVAGSGTGLSPSITSVGGDTNIDLALTPKGTGRVKYGTHTANADAPITGYIEIVDSGGTIRKLAVIT